MRPTEEALGREPMERTRQVSVWVTTFFLFAAFLVTLPLTISSVFPELDRRLGIPRNLELFIDQAPSISTSKSNSAKAPYTDLLRPPHTKGSIPSDCSNLPSTDDFLVVIKTGATEAYQRLPMQIATTLRCVPHSLLISDMDMVIGDHHVLDVLADLDDDTLAGQDLDLYRRQREYTSTHQELSYLVHERNAWDLDKYKFVPMLASAWTAREETTKWFIFLEADSAIHWGNVKALLDSRDPDKALYLGSPVFINDFAFAHGGSGFVLSRAAMQAAVGDSPTTWTRRFGGNATHECCGDFLLARALNESGIALTGAWPLFHGDAPSTAPIAENMWCRPVLTMHHVSLQQLAEINLINMEKGNATLLWKDVFSHFVEPNLAHLKLGWDNWSQDWVIGKERDKQYDGKGWHELSEIEKRAGESPEDCEALCQTREDCFQWAHHGSECRMSKSMRYGNPKLGIQEEHWVSGWQLERISRFEREHAHCEPDWSVDWRQ